jgi:2-dehydropantoate 2-reductase
MEFNNILICGVGGVGGYFGGKIAHEMNLSKGQRYNTYFLARGIHLKEIKQNGLKLYTSEEQTLMCRPTLASDDVNNFPIPDICFICVKSYDLDDLLISIKKVLTESTIIIPLMNGIDIYERIRKHLKKCVVLPSCVYVGSHIEKPGVVVQTGNPGFFYCGYDPKYPDFKPHKVLNFLESININVLWKDNPFPAIWEKYLLVASFALVSAYTGQTLGEITEDPNSRDVLEDIMNEIINIAEKKGIILKENIIPETIEFCRDYPDVKPSYARDVEKGGKNEGNLFGGTIIRLGKELSVPTPQTSSIYNHLK